MENNLAKTWGSIILLFMLLGFSSCNKDGDETISLEYGSIKKMIIGTWKIDDITHHGTKKSNFVFPNWINGTILTFFEDGTYMDSSDGGRRTHRWQLEPNSDSDSPYYGYIKLDNYKFDFSSMGTNRWVLGYLDNSDEDGNHEWEIDLLKEDDEQSDSEEEPEEKKKLIKTITKTVSHSVKSNDDYISIWDFKYDDKGRITDYNWKLNKLNIKRAYIYNNDNEVHLNTANGSTYGILESSRLVTFYRGLQICQFIYDENGFLKTMILSSKDGVWSYTYNFKYKDNNLYMHDYYEMGTNYIYTYDHSKELNDANIDLNPFIYVYHIDNSIFDQDYILEPYGFLGRRSKNLIKGYSKDVKGYSQHVNNNQFNNFIVKRDTNGNIIEITFSIIQYEDTCKTIIKIEYYD